MSAAALPVCLTRPPKLVLHPPPVSKSDIKPVPGFSHCCKKTTKKQARKGQWHCRSDRGARSSSSWLTCFCLQVKLQRRWSRGTCRRSGVHQRRYRPQQWPWTPLFYRNQSGFGGGFRCLTNKLWHKIKGISHYSHMPLPGWCLSTTQKQNEDVSCLWQDCTICMEPLGGPSGYKGPGMGPISRMESVGRLAQCGHQYHFQCLLAMYNNGNKDGR